MAKTKGKTFRLNEDDLRMFERLYPDLLPLFISRALFCAVRDNDLFQKIFFTPLLQSEVVKER